MRTMRLKSIFIIVLFILAGTMFASAQIDLSPRIKPPTYTEDYVIASTPTPLSYYDRFRDVDRYYTVFRIIDLNEKMNQPLFFPTRPEGNMKSLITAIIDGIANKSITPYTGTSEDFSTQILPDEELRAKYRYLPDENKDSIFYYALMKQLGETFDPIDVKKFYIKETWFFNTKESVFEMRVEGICPIGERYNMQTGQLLGEEQLFWIYYPEARDEFSKTLVPSWFNDATRMTLDEVFIDRFYAATIDKISTRNLSGRRIAEDLSGIDALYEAERIKEEIRNYEINLWEY